MPFIPQVSSGHVHNSNDQDTYMDNSDSALSSDEILCLRLLFSIFNTLLSWRGFNEPRNAKVRQFFIYKEDTQTLVTTCSNTKGI